MEYRDLMMRARGIVAVAAACVFLAACGRQTGDDAAAPDTAPKNVLIVLLDATTAGHLYPWGYARDPAPNFRGIARDGMLFLNAHSQAANTTPSVWSFSTGRYPYIPEPLDKYTTHRPYEADYLMPEAFRAAGFRTAAFSESPWVNSKYGWDKGFDHFQDVPALYDHKGLKWSRDPESTQRTFGLARDWIAGQGNTPWFCYVHVLRPHDPYDPPASHVARYAREPHRGDDHPRAEHRIREIAEADPSAVTQDDIDYLVDTYDANLRYVDELLGAFYDSLKDSGAADDTLIVLMSDHGEAFMEHGRFGHNTTAYEEMVHVPLAIIAPRGSGFAKGTYSGLVDLVDLMPTFRDLFALETPGPYPGTSLAPVLRGEAFEPRRRSISHSAVDHFRVALRDGDLKLIAQVDPAYREILSFELFDLAKDSKERHDLSDDTALAAPLLESMRAYLDAIERRDCTSDPVLDPDEQERLEALGYLGS